MNKEIRKEILDIVNDINYSPLLISELTELVKKRLNLDIDIQPIINDLIDNYDIFLNKTKDRIVSSRLANKYKGTIIIKNDTYGFITNPFYPDIYCYLENSQNSMNGDLCLYKIDKDNYNREEAIVIKVIKRVKEYLVGEVRFFRKKFYLIPVDKSIHLTCLITNPTGIKNGDIIRCHIDNYGNYLEVSKVDTLGTNQTIGIDITEKVYEANVLTDFSKEVLDYVNEITIDKDELLKRKTFNDKRIYTIDSIHAKDLDDAISIDILPNGNYELGVYIADVSYFVKEGSILDIDAFNRGTSIYLLDRVIPMLPVRLSNDLASLNPSEEKLVIALIMEVDKKGEVLDKKFYEGIIKTKKRLSYEACNCVLDGNTTDYPDYEPIQSDLNLMVELQKILETKRINRGAINFDLDEAEITLDEKGKPLDIEIKKRGISECIIEEFMILANETVAETLEELDLPAIYRVHDKPDNIKYMMLKNVVNAIGYKLNHLHPKEIQALISNLAEDDCYLKDSILRLMAKAVYSTDNIGHFGLASFAYTHFTSPIRRYPDLITHRLIRKYLFNNDSNNSLFIDYDDELKFKNKLELIASESSYHERVATDLEFKVIDMKKAEYMANFIGSIYNGVVSSVHKFGIFVNIGSTIEGLLHVSKLNNDYFYYSEESNSYYNKISKKELKVGSEIKVKLISASKINSEIDFDLVYNNTRGYRKWKR